MLLKKNKLLSYSWEAFRNSHLSKYSVKIKHVKYFPAPEFMLWLKKAAIKHNSASCEYLIFYLS